MITVPVFDGHNDTVLRLHDEAGTFLERDDAGHVDLPRARDGGLIGGLCALFVGSDGERPEAAFARGEFPSTPSLKKAQQRVYDLMATLLRLERQSAGRFVIVRTTAEIRRCIEHDQFAAVLHLEGAEAIDPRLSALEVLYAAGVRSIGPVWSRPNAFGHGVPITYPGSPDCGAGLTDQGRDLVRACNELGVLIDLSHMTERGFWDVAALTSAPLVASHSNAHALTATPRNLTDRQLDAIRESRGIVGLNFAVDFLRPDGRRDPATPLGDLIRHLDYLVERVGIDCVGFGSDFDGATMPDDLRDAAGLPNLLSALRDRAYTEAELHKLASENWLRVLQETWGA